MLETFDSLTEKYGGLEKIPDEALYEYITRVDVRTSLQNLQSVGLDKVPMTREVRRRSRTDLFWLVKYFLWGTNPAGVDKHIKENKITREEYQILCDFFVKKDNTKSIAEQDEFQNRLLLWPRGGFKSTIDVCDAVQWILNFPDIRILFLTGVDDLAVGFVRELKGHFAVKEGDVSLMNLFFPEFCMTEKELDSGNQFEFTCPIWQAKNVHRKEPTVMASSIGSTKSGLHFELIKADDSVCDRNSESPEQCQSISKKLFLAKKLLRTGGYYFELIGTRYADEDHYGVLIEKNVGDIRTTRGPCWEYTENISTSTKILVGRAIVIKAEVVQKLKVEGKPVIYKEAGTEGCDLLLPQIMSYAWLMREYNENEETFEGQLNQNPRPASFTIFDKEKLVANTVQFTELPSRGPISQTWDFAFSKKKGRDYCTGSSAIWNDKSQCFIHDLIRARFTPSDLAKAVVDFALKYRPFVISIEDAAGSRLLEPAIKAKALETGDIHIISLTNRIDWIAAETNKDAKKIRMAAMQPWVDAGRLKFAAHLPFISILYSEFEKCMTGSGHDDIPDVISRQLKHAPAMAQAILKNELQTFSRVEAGWKLLFEEGYQNPFGGSLLTHNPETGELNWVTEPISNPVVAVSEDSGMKSSPNGLDPILGSGILG
jgi:predicted phage terminase large subunit-like protein